MPTPTRARTHTHAQTGGDKIPCSPHEYIACANLLESRDVPAVRMARLALAVSAQCADLSAQLNAEYGISLVYGAACTYGHVTAGVVGNDMPTVAIFGEVRRQPWARAPTNVPV